jgi:hypothetical protein
MRIRPKLWTKERVENRVSVAYSAEKNSGMDSGELWDQIARQMGGARICAVAIDD